MAVSEKVLEYIRLRPKHYAIMPLFAGLQYYGKKQNDIF